MRAQARLMLVVLAVLVAGGVAWQLLFTADDAERLIITSADGATVRVAGGAAAQPVSAGHVVRDRDQLVVGDGGSAVLEMGEGTRLELAERSSIRVLEVDPEGVRVELEGGRLEARVTPGSPMLGIGSRGREIVARDADVRVGVDGDGVLAVTASRGEVEVQGVEGVQALQAGQRLGAMPEQPGVVDAATLALLLQVQWPDGAVRDGTIPVRGQTAPFARVDIDSAGGTSRTLRAGADGRFAAEVPLEEGANAVTVHASDPNGAEADAAGSVERDSRPPSATSVEVGWGP
jgi:hypothetical protein